MAVHVDFKFKTLTMNLNFGDFNPHTPNLALAAPNFPSMFAPTRVSIAQLERAQFPPASSIESFESSRPSNTGRMPVESTGSNLSKSVSSFRAFKGINVEFAFLYRVGPRQRIGLGNMWAFKNPLVSFNRRI